jgi:hypothetical protein
MTVTNARRCATNGSAINQAGIIVFANTDVDYRDRAEPREVLNALRQAKAA